MWEYQAKLIRIIDGDTVVLLVDTGFHGYRKETFRLLGVDTPEVRGPLKAFGQQATVFTSQWIEDAGVEEWPLVLTTTKGTPSDNFGRYLALISRKIDGRFLNTDLLESGNATVFKG